ncbi:MAG: ABC-2 transporter permease [Clostridia bacterium]|nr:ABC-2 transporter permease [Clostridia bacterium]
MNGLILKDMYMMKKYFRFSWVVVGIFLIVGAINEQFSFYHAYSCMMGGIVPISVLSFDEKERWMDYADTLPLSANTIVRSKYLFGLIFSLAVTALAIVSYMVNCMKNRGGDLSSVPAMASVFFFLSMLPAILLMPVLFRFGVEKGRILYYVLFGTLFAIVALTGITDSFRPTLRLNPAIALIATVILWIVSLLLSQAAYPKRPR